MRCYLIRHAQTDWNFENRIQGHSDPPLSALGRQQARRVGAYFAGRSIRALYTSHLARSLHTAQVIARATGVAPTVIPALAEIHLGAWEGLTPEEVNARYRGAYERWRTTPARVRIPGGEPVERFRARVRAAFTQIAAAHRNGVQGTSAAHAGELVIVTHGGTIASLLADWMRADYSHLLHRLVLDNAGISAVSYRSDPPCILWVNAVSHLPQPAAAAGVPLTASSSSWSSSGSAVSPGRRGSRTGRTSRRGASRTSRSRGSAA